MLPDYKHVTDTIENYILYGTNDMGILLQGTKIAKGTKIAIAKHMAVKLKGKNQAILHQMMESMGPHTNGQQTLLWHLCSQEVTQCWLSGYHVTSFIQVWH